MSPGVRKVLNSFGIQDHQIIYDRKINTYKLDNGHELILAELASSYFTNTARDKIFDIAIDNIMFVQYVNPRPGTIIEDVSRFNKFIEYGKVDIILDPFYRPDSLVDETQELKDDIMRTFGSELQEFLKIKKDKSEEPLNAFAKEHIWSIHDAHKEDYKTFIQKMGITNSVPFNKNFRSPEQIEFDKECI